MRSTTRQRHGETVRAGVAPHDWNARLASSLGVVLAAATVVATLALLTQEPAKAEMRWLLAFLATSLFLVSMFETRIAGRPPLRVRMARRATANLGTLATPGPHEGELLAAEPGNAVPGEDEVNIRQLASHRTDYVFTVSHELRTPLTSIRGFAQLITRGELPSSVAQTYASTIVDEADRLSRIVDDIVALTKMESAMLDLRADLVSPSDLVTRIVERLRSAREPIRLSAIVDGQLSMIRGDQERLDQAIEKLVLAAIDHSKPETQVLLLAQPDGTSVEIQVMFKTAPAQMAAVKEGIEDLWRCGTDGLATRLGRGSIDIYVAKNLIEAHGGSVGIKEVGEDDARISVTLPVSQGD